MDELRGPLTERAVEPSGAPPRHGRREWISIVAAVAVFLASSAAFLVAAEVSYRSTARAATREFSAQANSLSDNLATSLRRDTDFVIAQQALVTSFPTLTNRDLAGWYRAIGVQQRYPGSVGFVFVERVPATRLKRFEATVIADPPVNIKITAPYALIASSHRVEYCLQRFGIAEVAEHTEQIAPTLDFCSPTIPGVGASPLPALLAEAAVSGRSTVLDASSDPTARRLGDLLIIFDPTYPEGRTPSTVASRQSELLGWMVGTFSQRTLMMGALGTAARSTHMTLRFAGSNGALQLAAAGGHVPAGVATVTQTRAFSADDTRWVSVVVGERSGAPLRDGLLIAALGLAIERAARRRRAADHSVEGTCAPPRRRAHWPASPSGAARLAHGAAEQDARVGPRRADAGARRAPPARRRGAVRRPRRLQGHQ